VTTIESTMQEVKSNLYPCKHCSGTGTCSSGEAGTSCTACAQSHNLVKTYTLRKTYTGLACGTCGGLGMAEPYTERLNKRTKPLLAMGIVFILLVCTTALAFVNNEHFPAFLAFSGTLIGSITTFYFSSGKTNP